jgi:hypothetical protein
MSEEVVPLEELLTALVNALEVENGTVATAELLRKHAKRLTTKARRATKAETEPAKMEAGKRGRGRPVANKTGLAFLSVGMSQAEAAAALTDKEDHRRAKAEEIRRARKQNQHLLLPYIGAIHELADSKGITFDEALLRARADLTEVLQILTSPAQKKL